MQTDAPISPYVQVLNMTGGKNLTIQDGGWILQADCVPMGSDLLLVGKGGMQVSTSIHTGQRTVLEYLIDPFLDARDRALQER